MNRLYTDYRAAESDCDMIAGDNGLHMVVIERFDLEGPAGAATTQFAAVVLNANEAHDYLTLHEGEAEVIYESDHTDEARARQG